LKQRYENYESSAALTTVVPARTMASNFFREELQAMRHTSFARPCNAAAKCAVGSACSAANTDNNSILLLTIDTVLAVSIFAILSILGIAPPAERTKPVFAG
jgi:hypothetical protein